MFLIGLPPNQFLDTPLRDPVFVTEYPEYVCKFTDENKLKKKKKMQKVSFVGCVYARTVVRVRISRGERSDNEFAGWLRT